MGRLERGGIIGIYWGISDLGVKSTNLGVAGVAEASSSVFARSVQVDTESCMSIILGTC